MVNDNSADNNQQHPQETATPLGDIPQIQSTPHAERAKNPVVQNISNWLGISWRWIVADYRKVSVERIKHWVEIVGIIIAALVVRIYFHQWQEMASQTQLLAEQANRSVIENIGNTASTNRQLDLLRQQTEATQKSMALIQEQIRNSRYENGARLILTNVVFNNSPLESSSITFDIVNEGNSEATKIARREGTIFNEWTPNTDKIKQSMGPARGLKQETSGFALAKSGSAGDNHPFIIQLGARPPRSPVLIWWHWEKFAYFDIYGHERHICRVIHAYGNKGQMARIEDCPPEENK